MDDMEALATRAQPELTKDPPNAFALRELEDIFKEHHKLVFQTAYRITGNAQDSEDVLQTVFLRLARREEDAAQVDHIPSYLRRAATNAAFDLLRSRQRANSAPLEDVEPILAGDAAKSPERLYQATEMRDWLRRTVARLSPMSAQIFALRFFEGKDNGEIAKIVGTTTGAVSVTLSRARERVEKEFQAYWRKS